MRMRKNTSSQSTIPSPTPPPPGRSYTGVGSRATPGPILDLMEKIATRLSKENLVLRSGGATGADTAFEIRASKKEIFYASDATHKAMGIAAQFHPAWGRCSDQAKQLHGRNAFQVLGKQLDSPSEFLICWTKDGCLSHNTRRSTTGGTGTAISIADHSGVPVFNLGNQDHLLLWTRWANSQASIDKLLDYVAQKNFLAPKEEDLDDQDSYCLPGMG